MTQWDRKTSVLNFHLSPRLCPSTAGCSPPSMSSIVLCLVAFLFHLSPRLCPSTAGCSPPSMSSIVLCLVAFLFHLSPRLCPATAGCSLLSMSFIVFCLLLSCFTFHLGFVHPLQDLALHQCLPLSSVCCFPVPGGSLPVVLPSCLGRPLDRAKLTKVITIIKK